LCDVRRVAVTDCFKTEVFLNIYTDNGDSEITTVRCIGISNLHVN